MNPSQTPDRCRLVLIAPAEAGAERILAAFDGGDVASLILPPWSLDEAAFQRLTETVVPAAQAQGAAVMVAGDTRAAGRSGADGLHVEAPKTELDDAIARHRPKLMIGAGGIKTRDDALEIGELRPDYVFFGRFGYDNQPEPHPRNLGLARWWAEMIEIPCVVLGGSTVASVEAVAVTGAEFVALSSAVFAEDVDPADAVRRVNALLDAHAPRFSGAGAGHG